MANNKIFFSQIVWYLFLGIWGGLILLCLWNSVFWLFYGLLFILIAVFIFKKKKISSKVIQGLLYTFIPIILALTFRIFIFEVCAVPSSSMENNLLIGDRIIINKLPYGPRMPRSIVEVPWLHGIFFYLMGNKAYIQKQKLAEKSPFIRLKGFRKLEKNDIIIFESPTKKGELLVKRIVALPGDTLEVRNGQTFINGIKNQSPNLGKQRYNLWIHNAYKAKKILDSLQISYYETKNIQSPKQPLWTAKLTFDEYSVINSNYNIDSIKASKSQAILEDTTWQGDNLWTFSNFGPLIIPKKGDKIKLTGLHKRKMYQQVFTREGTENNSLALILKNNYYFVMGDNRDNSIDSRSFGFIPADHIIGKGTIILFSTNKQNSFLSRFIKYIK